MVLEQLADKRVYVTGTSRGIGEALAEVALDHGAIVVGTSFHSDPKVALHTREKYHHFKYDAGHSEGMFMHAREIVACGGKPDVVLFNASAFHPYSPLSAAVSQSDYARAVEESMHVSVTGPL